MMTTRLAERAATQAELMQEAHYDLIADDYEAHYGDASSQEYRHRFIYAPLFDGVNLSGASVLDAMCGSGQTSQYLLSRGAIMTGLDVSSQSMNLFAKRLPECTAVCASILSSGLKSESFDCIVVIGGLHHLHPELNESILEIHRLLKPGGRFCFAEPHQASLFDGLRRLWYKRDRLFSDNEAAVDADAMKRDFTQMFEFEVETYVGSFAYLAVLNSMVFRLPTKLKPIYSPALMSLESVTNRFQGKHLSCAGLFRWRKR